MSHTVRIALDAMGGDHGPAVVVAGADLALARHPDSEFLFFGNTSVVAPLIAARPALKSVSRLVHSEIAVRMEDKPSQALRYGRRKSSMWLAIESVKKQEADMAVSAGNTGALMAMSKFELKMLPGIDTPRHRGAVADRARRIDRARRRRLDRRRCRAPGRPRGHGCGHGTHLVRVEAGDGRVAQYRGGGGQGLEQVREAGRILREEHWPDLDYVGFVEGDDIGTGKVDVVVTEGFAGNIALKTAEGTARQMAQYLRGAITRSLSARIGYFFARSAFRQVARTHGPAPRQWRGFSRAERHRHQSHGGTDAEGFAAAIALGHGVVRDELLGKITAALGRLHGERQQALARSRVMTVRRSVVLGCGSDPPSHILTNAELARKVDTSDDWIVQRTGIHERRIAAPGESTSHMATHARARRARPCQARCAGDRSHRAGDLDAR